MAAARSNVAPETFRAITRTVLFDHTAASSSMNRVDDAHPPNPHLPPHLREVCDILARGLLRLRSRGMAVEVVETAEHGDIRLHSTAPQRRYANPKREGTA